MSELKATPGPWNWEDAGNGKAFLIHPDDDNPEFGTIIVHALDDIDPPDAHLIAAAPELYEALDRLADLCTGIDDEGELDDAREALAKARGES